MQRGARPLKAALPDTLQPKAVATMEIALIVAVIAVIFIVRTFKIVPQQNAWASTTARSPPA